MITLMPSYTTGMTVLTDCCSYCHSFEDCS